MNLDSLYQEVILDHAKHPHNYGEPESYDAHAHRLNTTCGDSVDVYLTIGEDNRIAEVMFSGRGCAISQASASMMTDIVQGRTLEEAHTALRDFQSKMMDREAEFAFDDEAMEELETLQGVRQFPNRIRCATLAWHTLEDALSEVEE
ncbi:MAG: Fe-S cluster assembly sulfur transfer protein SufU [Chloroflexota bacterium]